MIEGSARDYVGSILSSSKLLTCSALLFAHSSAKEEILQIYFESFKGVLGKSRVIVKWKHFYLLLASVVMLFVAFVPNEQEIHCTCTFNFASLWATFSLGACRGKLKHNLDFSCNAEIQLLMVSVRTTFTYTSAFIWLLKIPLGTFFGCWLQNRT